MSLEVYKFTVPFKEPFKVAGCEYTNRSGLYICHNNNITEASPLFHITDQDIQITISYLKKHRLNVDTDGFHHLPPYIQWAIDSQNIQGHKIDIKCNALLTSPQTVDEKVVKFKLNNHHPAQEQKILLDIIELNPSITLRLDANNSWSLDQSIYWLQELPAKVKARIDYIEEPLKNMNRIEEFYEYTQTPYAIDQSLDIHKLKSYKTYRGLHKIILKPSSQNTPQEVQAWIENFPNKCIVTSSLDTQIGLHKLNGLIHKYNLENETHGLNTLHLLDLDHIREEKLYEL